MKAFFCSALAFMSLASCNGDAIKGNEYVLKSPSYKTEITIGFDKAANRFYGKALNNYFGNYTVKKNKINFGQVGSTMMAGPADVMDEEYKYLRALDGEKTFELTKDKLILISPNGTKNVYVKK